MPRDLSNYYSSLFRDPKERETRHINPDGKFAIQANSGLPTARDLSSVNLYRGKNSSGIGDIQSRFYTSFRGEDRRPVLHKFDTSSLTAKKADIQTKKILPTTKAKDTPYYKADLGEPESEEGIGSALLTAATLAGLAFVVYRGMRGAGFLPFGERLIDKKSLFDIKVSKWFRPLSKDFVINKKFKIPEIRIPGMKKPLIKGRTMRVVGGVRSVRYHNIKSAAWGATESELGSYLNIPAGSARREFVKQFIANRAQLTKSGFGLRGPAESVGHLFSRTIESIPEFLEIAGVNKGIVDQAKKIPKWILSGQSSAMPGFSKVPSGMKKAFQLSGFTPGVRTPLGIIGRVATRVMLPAYIATVGYNYLDYRTRRAEVLDKTPLRGGITEAGAGMWVKSRMFMQKNLERLGVLDFNKYMQTQFPGYLRAAGLVAGMALGIKNLQAKGFLASLMRVFAGGVAGYVAERGLSYSPEQLERIYSGEEDVAVKRGRWWEFGRTAFEGGRTSFYRPHWYPLLKSRYREQGALYPSEDWKWQHHWLVGPLTGNKFDPYAWEKEYYKERPYPVTSGAFEDVPLIGPALEATLGRIIKPRRLMHTDEWLGPEGMAPQPKETERIRRMPADTAETLQLEGIPRGGMGEVISQADLRHNIGEQQYRLTEWFGLPGFYMQEALRNVTGRESLFEQSRLQSSSRATGFERSYWDRDLGGLLGTTEIFRRFFPHRRRQIDEYNPIENVMGKEQPWLPGPEYFIDFKHGDPYIKVPMGEARLPGTGYEALYELHSNIPGVYDPVDRFLILADVAPYSQQYKHYRAIVDMWSRSGVLDKTWKGKVSTAREQRQARMKRYDFQPRRFSRVRKQVDEALTTSNLGKIEEGASRAWESATHTLSNIPVPGVSFIFGKLMPTRDPIEHYERFQVFGREAAFWGHPIRDFLKVYGQEWMGKINPTGIPSDVRKRRDIEEYFDKLEYIKYKQLAQRSREVEEYGVAKEFDKRSKETLHGLDSYGSWVNIFRAMPRSERDYFTEFSGAQGEERERISELVPDYMRRIYEAQWQIKDRKAGIDAEYKNIERQDNEDLSNFFSEHHLPGPNWLGWHPDVDLDKVKLKVVKNEALDMHDFNLWRSQEEEARREPIPFIRDFRTPNPQYDTPALRRDLIEELTNSGFDFPEISITTQPSQTPDTSRVNIDFDIAYDQSNKILQRAKGRVPLTV